MVKYVIKRILLAILILFGVSVILYILLRCLPTDFVTQKFSAAAASGGLNDDDLLRIKALYGLDDNSFFGIIKGYFSWLGNFIQGDMGTSFKFCQPVSDVILDSIGISFLISFVALILEVLIAIPLGIKCACNQYGKFDYVVTILCMIGMAFPSFFLANLLIKWFAIDLGWFDIGGLNSYGLGNVDGFTYFLDTAWHLVLPIAVLVILDIGGLMRYTRTNTLEVLNADYIRTARAKGLSEHTVIYKHVFRNTMIPLVTMLSFTLPSLFGGAMITETVFSIPGIGYKAYQALSEGDIPLTMGYNMFLALLTVVGTLFADIMYAVVDPRVKLVK
jgi:peptide/nickel transport system permease protein